MILLNKVKYIANIAQNLQDQSYVNTVIADAQKIICLWFGMLNTFKH